MNPSSPSPMRPTMKAIAEETGFSIMTASLALPDHPRISKETEARVAHWFEKHRR